jgi:hypothetical protein
MSFVLFVLSVVAAFAAYGLYERGQRLEAVVLVVAAAVLFSGAAVVSVLTNLGEDFAKRFPRTPLEKMEAWVREHPPETSKAQERKE